LFIFENFVHFISGADLAADVFVHTKGNWTLRVVVAVQGHILLLRRSRLDRNTQ